MEIKLAFWLINPISDLLRGAAQQTKKDIEKGVKRVSDITYAMRLLELTLS